MKAISHTSAMYGIALFCLVANWCILNDGMTLWKFRFVQFTHFMDHLKLILLIVGVVSMVFGSIMYYLFKFKRYMMFWFWPGLVVGNLFIYLSSQYIWVIGYQNIIQGWFIFGHILIYMCSGALLPCLIDFGFVQVPDNIDHDKAVSIYGGAIFFDLILGYLYSWHALIEYKAAQLEFPLSPIILSTVGLVLVIVEGLLYQFVYKLPEIEKDEKVIVEEDPAVKAAKFRTKIFYTSTMLMGMMCLWVFYFLKYPFINYWLGFINMVVSNLGGIMYSERMLFEQYLYSLLFACIIIKIVLFRNGLTWPIACIVLGMLLFLYALYLSTEITTQIKKKYRNRYAQPDNNHSKVIFMNLLNRDIEVIGYRKSRGNFLLKRMEANFLIRGSGNWNITDVQEVDCFLLPAYFSEYNQCVSLPNIFKFQHIERYVSLSPQTLNVVTYNPDTARVCADEFTPREQMFHSSTRLAYACCFNAPFKERNDDPITLTSIDGAITYTFHFWSCRFMLPGKYRMNIGDKPALHLDQYYIDAGGSYFLFISKPDKLIPNENPAYPKETVATYMVWRRALAMNIVVLIPQYIMLGLTEVLLFTGFMGYLYSTPDSKSHILLLGLFFAVGSIAYIFHISNPSFIFTIYRNFHKILALLIFLLCCVGAIRLFQLHPEWDWILLNIWMRIKGIFISFWLWLKLNILLPIYLRILKLIAKDYEKALKLGLCAVDDPDDDDVDRPKEHHEKPPPPPPPPPPVIVPFQDPNARTIYKKKPKPTKKGDKLHNPTYGEDFLDTIEK